MSTQVQKLIAASITLAALCAPLYVWAHPLSSLADMSLYELFPVFGLLAFSIFWLQIMALGFEPLLHFSAKPFLRWSGHAFMLFVLLHPFLLAVAQLNNQFGLPLQSFYTYVPARLTLYLNFAIIAFIVFIVTELSFWFSNVAWVKKWVVPLEYLNYVAFYLIFWHSLHLGQHLQSGWLLGIWWFFAITALPIIVTLVARRINNSPRIKAQATIQ